MKFAGSLNMMRSKLLPFLILFWASHAFAQNYPESLTVLNGGEDITSRKPCVALNETGESSLQNVLERLDTSMVPPRDFFYGSNPNDCSLPRESDSSPNVRLVLFKPDGLTDDSTYHTRSKAITSKITKSLHLTVPNEEHLIIGGYKTMYHSDCLGQDCDDKVWGGCLGGAFNFVLSDYRWDASEPPSSPLSAESCLGPAFSNGRGEDSGAQPDVLFFTWDTCQNNEEKIRQWKEDRYRERPGCGRFVTTGRGFTAPHEEDICGPTHGGPYEEVMEMLADPRELCERTLGPTMHAFTYNLNKDNYRETAISPRDYLTSFPLTTDVVNDTLDFSKNPIFDCNYFDTHKATTICHGDAGYRAEITLEGSHDLVFEVDGQLSLRYLDIRLKLSNSKVKFVGRGTVEFTEVAIYGEAATRTMVEFGPEIDVVLLKNSHRPVTEGSYGLALFPQGIGIQNYITASNLGVLATLTRYTRQDLLYPELKLVIPAKLNPPIPFDFTEQSFAIPCFINEEGDECQLEDDNVPIIVTLKPQNGHFVQQEPIIISNGKLPLVENGFYYSLAWKPIYVQESPTTDPPAASPSDSSLSKRKKYLIGETVVATPDPDCAENEILNFGRCIRVERPPSGGGGGDNEPEGEIPPPSGGNENEIGGNLIDPWGAIQNVNRGGSGCSLNVHGTPKATILFWILFAGLVGIRIHNNRLNILE